MAPPTARQSIRTYVGKKPPKQSIIAIPRLSDDPFDNLLNNPKSNSNMFESSSETQQSPSQSSLEAEKINCDNTCSGKIKTPKSSFSSYTPTPKPPLRRIKGCTDIFKKKKKSFSSIKKNKIKNSFHESEISVGCELASSTPIIKRFASKRLNLGSNNKSTDKISPKLSLITKNDVSDTGQLINISESDLSLFNTRIKKKSWTELTLYSTLKEFFSSPSQSKVKSKSEKKETISCTENFRSKFTVLSDKNVDEKKDESVCKQKEISKSTLINKTSQLEESFKKNVVENTPENVSISDSFNFNNCISIKKSSLGNKDVIESSLDDRSFKISIISENYSIKKNLFGNELLRQNAVGDSSIDTSYLCDRSVKESSINGSNLVDLSTDKISIDDSQMNSTDSSVEKSSMNDISSKEDSNSDRLTKETHESIVSLSGNESDSFDFIEKDDSINRISLKDSTVNDSFVKEDPSFNSSTKSLKNDDSLTRDFSELSIYKVYEKDRVTVRRRKQFCHSDEISEHNSIDSVSLHSSRSGSAEDISRNPFVKSESFIRSPISDRRSFVKNYKGGRKNYEKLSQSLPAWFKDSQTASSTGSGTCVVGSVGLSSYDRMYDDPRRNRKSLSRMKDYMSSSTKSLPAVLEDQDLEKNNVEESRRCRGNYKKNYMNQEQNYSFANPVHLGFTISNCSSDGVKRRGLIMKKHSEDSSCTSPHTLPVLPEDDSDSSSGDESKRLESESSSQIGSPSNSPSIQGSPRRELNRGVVACKHSISYMSDGTSELSLSSRSEDVVTPQDDGLSPRASSPEPSAPSSEEDSGSSPIRRDENRRRRPSRLSTRRTLGYIAEEGELDATDLSNRPNMSIQPLYLLPGKKCRRSIAIIKNHIINEEPVINENKGRKFLESVETLKKLQKVKDLSHLDCDELSIISPDARKSQTSVRLSCDKVNNSILSEEYDYSPDSRMSFYNRTVLPRRSTLCLINNKPVNVSLACTTLTNNFNKSCFSETLTNDTVIESDEISAQMVLLQISGQKEILNFSEIFSDGSLDTWEKIGEGVYSEVFSLTRLNQMKTVLKIIPVGGSIIVNGGPQKSLYDNMFEVFITKFISELSHEQNTFGGFVQLAQVWYIEGSYPKELVKLWDEFNDSCGSDNDHPNIFPEDQKYLGLELVNSGKALEAYRFITAKQSFSILQQLIFSLAIAEYHYEFEHRDLHWGNVLVDRTKDKSIEYEINGQSYTVFTNSLKATIIDYTWSRITKQTPEGDMSLFNDMEQDPELFIGEGDLQFEIYRQMRNDVERDWNRYKPKTNIRWLYYITDKLLNNVKYCRPWTNTHRIAMDSMNKLHEEILSFDSCLELAEKMNQFM